MTSRPPPLPGPPAPPRFRHSMAAAAAIPIAPSHPIQPIKTLNTHRTTPSNAALRQTHRMCHRTPLGRRQIGPPLTVPTDVRRAGTTRITPRHYSTRAHQGNSTPRTLPSTSATPHHTTPLCIKLPKRAALRMGCPRVGPRVGHSHPHPPSPSLSHLCPPATRLPSCRLSLAQQNMEIRDPPNPLAHRAHRAARSVRLGRTSSSPTAPRPIKRNCQPATTGGRFPEGRRQATPHPCPLTPKAKRTDRWASTASAARHIHTMAIKTWAGPCHSLPTTLTPTKP